MRLFAVFIVILSFSGCAAGNKTSYEGRSNFQIKTDKSVIVAVHDLRPYVQSLNKSPDFTGIMKSLYGIPYNVTTKSGNPLADEFGSMIVNTMEFRNISARQELIPFSWTFNTVQKELLGKDKKAHFYYIKMLEWKTETHFRPALHFNLQLLVFNEHAEQISINQEKGFFYFDKNQPGKENLASATSSILERLFSRNKQLRDSSKYTAVETKKIDKTAPQEAENTKFVFGSLPMNVQKQIRKKCSQDFPGDFTEQYNCANRQTTGWYEINKSL